MSSNTSNIVIPDDETLNSETFKVRKDEGEKQKAKFEHYKANPGPVIPEDSAKLPKALSSEELKKQAAALNSEQQ